MQGPVRRSAFALGKMASAVWAIRRSENARQRASAADCSAAASWSSSNFSSGSIACGSAACPAMSMSAARSSCARFDPDQGQRRPIAAGCPAELPVESARIGF